MPFSASQNWDISQKRAGFELTGPELADWMIKLQEFGKCHNINLVTPEHVAPQVGYVHANVAKEETLHSIEKLTLSTKDHTYGEGTQHQPDCGKNK